MTTNTAGTARVHQLRLIVEAEDFDAAVAFYRDALGLTEQAAFQGDGEAQVMILNAGSATLEVSNPAQVRMIDRIEADGSPSAVGGLDSADTSARRYADLTAERGEHRPMASILMISGSVRAGSVNAAMIATAAELFPAGVAPVIYSGLADLPHFNPDLDHEPLPTSVVELRRLIRESSALLFSTPEYAGTMPGALKNLLEWTVGGTETTHKPTGWINPSSMPNRAAGTYSALRIVLEYTDATVVDRACVDVPVPRSAIGTDGVVQDERIRGAISRTVLALVAAIEAAELP
jgi:NAD(P)H-dependent FMN reductase